MSGVNKTYKTRLAEDLNGYFSSVFTKEDISSLPVADAKFQGAKSDYLGGSRGLVVKLLDSKFEGCEFKTHTGHGSFSKLRQFRLPYFASVYSAANEYKHCLEGTCDGLVSRPGESV